MRAKLWILDRVTKILGLTVQCNGHSFGKMGPRNDERHWHRNSKAVKCVVGPNGYKDVVRSLRKEAAITRERQREDSLSEVTY